MQFSVDTPDDRARAKRALMAEELAYALCTARDRIYEILESGALPEVSEQELRNLLGDMSETLEIVDYT